MDKTTNQWPEMHLEPIGRVSSNIKEPILLAGKSGLSLQQRMDKVREHHREIRDADSDLLVFDRWAPLLEGIEAFSHILVLYWPHLIDPQRRQTLEKVHPMGRQDLPEQGIFATCSRPGPIRSWFQRSGSSNGRETSLRSGDWKQWTTAPWWTSNPT